MLSPYDDAGYALDDKHIGRGVTLVKGLGRNRLSDCLEMISPALDPGFTAECTQPGLLCLLWCYTRVKPSVRIADLRGFGFDYNMIDCFFFLKA